MPSGLHCQSPAMRGSGFCYFHARPQRPAHPNEGRPKEARLDLPALLDPKGTQTAISRIISALAAGQISTRRAGVLLYAIQMSSSHTAQVPIPQIPIPAP